MIVIAADSTRELGGDCQLWTTIAPAAAGIWLTPRQGGRILEARQHDVDLRVHEPDAKGQSDRRLPVELTDHGTSTDPAPGSN